MTKKTTWAAAWLGMVLSVVLIALQGAQKTTLPGWFSNTGGLLLAATLQFSLTALMADAKRPSSRSERELLPWMSLAGATWLIYLPGLRPHLSFDQFSFWIPLILAMGTFAGLGTRRTTLGALCLIGVLLSPIGNIGFWCAVPLAGYIKNHRKSLLYLGTLVLIGMIHGSIYSGAGWVVPWDLLWHRQGFWSFLYEILHGTQQILLLGVIGLFYRSLPKSVLVLLPISLTGALVTSQHWFLAQALWTWIWLLPPALDLLSKQARSISDRVAIFFLLFITYTSLMEVRPTGSLEFYAYPIWKTTAGALMIFLLEIVTVTSLRRIFK